MREWPLYYFTYGMDGRQPYVGGWTVISAPSRALAAEIFRAYHPDREKGILNCAFQYTEEEFTATEMPEKGNFGARCREIIRVERMPGREPGYRKEAAEDGKTEQQADS